MTPPSFSDTDMEIDIERIVAKVIADKESRAKGPIQCDMHDIIRDIIPDITNDMRRLIKEGKYEGSITINKIPILRKKDE